MSKFSPRRAFTLIELLVVIAIIAILAAILFPVFGRARENARRTSCLNNMKQIGISTLQYTQDYDEFYPFSRVQGLTQLPPNGAFWENTKTTWFWPQTLYAYHKSEQVFRCPSVDYAGFPQDLNYGANGFMMPTSSGTSAFGDRRLPSTGPNGTGLLLPINLATIASPAQTYMVVESGAFVISPSNVRSPFSSTVNTNGFYLPGSRQAGVTLGNCPAVDPGKSDCNTGRHFGGVNVTFADGHAKWLKSGVLVVDASKNIGTPSFNAFGGWNPANS